ncbi:estradiol 17-beta-dehydrogenase 8-like isoform X1 [Homalodisca vitripennis]|uniref:estradiol 17-beta-dehydrogenase 8-like isoform X1 n=1 Tax=Homalodisca vitripennis TaxID=197043 RepID=UPI001EEB21D0|nr:estradiol 17-beta-dehydrogenase 8-like isoform X1 [Homalodisca vitripennis]
MSDSRSVDGRLALVTGASSGIGRETCKVLAREGATVVVTCINEAGAQETVTLLEGSNHTAMRYDVTQFDSGKELLKSIIQKYGRPPNILVNSAGIATVIGLLDETPETFQRVLDVNLKGTVFTIQAVCRELVAANMPGSVVNISSRTVGRPLKYISAYVASKGGVDGITKCFAKEMGPHGIRINSVQPGMIKTPMLGEDNSSDMVNDWVADTSTKRLGQPQEVAEVITFLASDRASYINGAHITISDTY